MEKKYIKGQFNKAIFKSDNGYIIGLLKLIETNEEQLVEYINKLITFTGYFADLKEDIYIFYGELIEHPKYGLQYNVKESERIKPEDKDGIIEFLSSDLFKGVGIKLATSIVNTLKEKTLDLILEDKNNLLLVPKITHKKATEIYETLLKYEESHKTIVYLTELGFTMKDSLIIYNKYKTNTISTLDHNIYSIIDEVDNISFLKVDEIGNKLQIDLNDERRIKAGIIYICNKITYSTGDTYLYLDEIINNSIKYLKIDEKEENIKLYIDELRYENKLVLDKDKYYLKEIYDSEQEIIKKINYLNNKEEIQHKKMNNYIANLEREFEINYNETQIEAIKKAMEKNILIITGGPGTGKTTIIKAIVELYKQINKYNYDTLINKIALLAPTGRASKRMSESTSYPASTIHRFLKWNKETNEFLVDENNKNLSELIIVDEVSMIDINLLANLFRGLTNNIKLILVGDYNQLPSVGPGQVLKDMIESNVIDIVHLDLLYRQLENSYIPVLANEIKNDDISESYLDTTSDYTFLKCNSEFIIDNLKNLCVKLIEKDYDYKKIQIMAPMYAGINGIDNLNKVLQEIFNPKNKLKKEYKYGDIIFRENDKILQLVNMPEENVFNGDIGVIKFILDEKTSDSKKTEIYVDYDGFVIKYLPHDLTKIKHGYVISIHKSQGSEFDFTIIPICHNYSRMLYKKLIYTGITRAKKKLVLIGQPDAFLKSINNNNELQRKTDLANKLKNMYN
ncbi:MAG: ATP-dependent RecD-like DNA helicase [Bacilli bacterium]|nr:ATP-dependent RecD-like DNA helicase [Bacilli bacterium]